MLDDSLSQPQQLVIVLAMLKTLDENNKSEKKEKTRLMELADEYFDVLSDIELEAVKASADHLVRSGFPNITEVDLQKHLAILKT